MWKKTQGTNGHLQPQVIATVITSIYSNNIINWEDWNLYNTSFRNSFFARAVLEESKIATCFHHFSAIINVYKSYKLINAVCDTFTST